MNPLSARLLVVEDDREIRETVGDVLAGEGYDVRLAGNGREALDRLKMGDIPDLIILDLRMPVMDGWEFRAAQKNTPALANIPVIAVSADGSAKAEAIAAQAYLRKPLSLDSLLEAVERVLADVERRQLRGRIEEAERFAALGRLAASVGHEINNPLAYVSMNVELATEELARLPAPAQVDHTLEGRGSRLRLAALQEMLRDARIGLDRIRDVVKDLQSLSRTAPAKNEVFSLNELLDETLTMARNHVEHRAAIVKAYGDLPAFTGNRSGLGQVFLNLLLNAAQSLPTGRADANAITITTSHEDEACAVEIRDTGSGIPPEVLPHIFTAFYTTKAVGEGTGLGLAVSHRIVTAHGGRISVASELGKGTAVRVVLPVATGASAGDAVGGSPASRTTAGGAAIEHRSRVLVIDDEPLVGRAIETVLAGEHEVVLTVRAADAFARLAAGEVYDVILCDLLMPEFGGREVYERLAAEWPQLVPRVVFMTGGAFTPEASEFLRENPRRILAKPFTPGELRALVRAQIAGDVGERNDRS